MKPISMKQLLWVPIALVAAVTAVSFTSLTHAGGVRTPVVPPNPSPGGVYAIVAAQPFVLDRAWRHTWRKEQPQFDAGWLLVLSVDPTLVVPRQLEEPVLYAGAQTVERVNIGQESGRVIAILPSARDAHGDVALDLAATPFYFGSNELPERVTALQAQTQLEHALAQGVRPLPVPHIGETLRLPSRDELDQRAALLVLEHAPDEYDLGTGLLAPRVQIK
jgi:hypothetical protein